MVRRRLRCWRCAGDAECPAETGAGAARRRTAAAVGGGEGGGGGGGSLTAPDCQEPRRPHRAPAAVVSVGSGRTSSAGGETLWTAAARSDDLRPDLTWPDLT